MIDRGAGRADDSECTDLSYVIQSGLPLKSVALKWRNITCSRYGADLTRTASSSITR